MNTEWHRVKTERGYYYSTGNGRYGRLDGQALYAEVMCQQHAGVIAESFAALSIQAEIEEYPGTVRECMKCQREK